MAPPCSLYEKIQPLAVLQAAAMDFAECVSLAETGDKRKTLQLLKAPVCDLLNTSMAALRDMNKAHTQLLQAKENVAKDSASASTARPSTPSAAAAAAQQNRAATIREVGVLSEAVVNILEPMRTVMLPAEFQDIDLALPAAVKIAPDQYSKLWNTAQIKQCMDAFYA